MNPDHHGFGHPKGNVRPFVTPFSLSEPENSWLVFEHRTCRGVVNVPPAGDLTNGVVFFHGEVGDGRDCFFFFKQRRYKFPRRKKSVSVRSLMRRIAIISRVCKSS